MNILRLLDGLVHLPVAGDERRPGHDEGLHSREGLALDQLQRRAAARRQVVHLVGEAELRERRGASPRRRRRSCRGASRDGLGDRARAGRERLELEGAHRAVPEDGAGLRDDLGVRPRPSPGRCRGPSSRPATSTPSVACVSVSAENSRPSSRSTGSSSLSRSASARWAGSMPSSSHSDVADVVALRLEEREAHRAADQDGVGALEERVDARRSCPSPSRRRRSRPAAAAGSSRMPVERLDLALRAAGRRRAAAGARRPRSRRARGGRSRRRR